jgi:hypothetical protein
MAACTRARLRNGPRAIVRCNRIQHERSEQPLPRLLLSGPPPCAQATGQEPIGFKPACIAPQGASGLMPAVLRAIAHDHRDDPELAGECGAAYRCPAPRGSRRSWWQLSGKSPSWRGRAVAKSLIRQGRRGGRVAEGGGLLNRYTVISRIVGSNPIPSANQRLAAFQPATNRYCCAGNCADYVPSAFAPRRLATRCSAGVRNAR